MWCFVWISWQHLTTKHEFNMHGDAMKGLFTSIKFTILEANTPLVLNR